MTNNLVMVRHSAVELALHELHGGEGRPLLLLHGLGEATPAVAPDWAAPWAGPIWGLDFTGHGASTIPRGGGYSAEVLMGDADAALSVLGPSTVVGRGVGAYVAVLIAGARPQLVRGAALLDGTGMAGGGTVPASAIITHVDPASEPVPDPWALIELARDVRPPDYATAFVRQATQLSGLQWPIAVCARTRPPWLEAVATEPGVLDTDIAEALAVFSAA